MKFSLKEVPQNEPEKNFYNETAILKNWQKRVQNPGAHYLLDLDENLFNTFGYWVDHFNGFLRLRYGITSLPDRDTVAMHGGPSNYYPRNYPNIFSSNPQSPLNFENIAESMRHRYFPNKAGVFMGPHSLTALLQTLENSGNILGGLTARPASQDAIRGTREQIANAFPVIYKPLSVSLIDASREKMRIIEKLLQSSENSMQSDIILIDDSIRTAQTLSELNEGRIKHGKKPVLYFLNGQGPLTQPRLHQFENEKDTMKGVFLFHDWTEVPQLTKEAQLWRSKLTR